MGYAGKNLRSVANTRIEDLNSCITGYSCIMQVKSLKIETKLLKYILEDVILNEKNRTYLNVFLRLGL